VPPHPAERPHDITALCQTKSTKTLRDRVMVLRPSRLRTRYFGDVLPSQSLGLVLKKLNPIQQKAVIQE